MDDSLGPMEMTDSITSTGVSTRKLNRVAARAHKKIIYGADKEPLIEKQEAFALELESRLIKTKY